MNAAFLDGKVALVTGGAQGIGWAVTQVLADHGASVYVCDISEDHLASARRQAAELGWGDRIMLTQCDVSDRDALVNWITRAYQQSGHIDVLVNNAMFTRWQDVADTSIEDAERMIRVGYCAMVYSVKTVLPLMQAAGGGHIVNIGSSAGRLFVGSASAAYCAAKAAMDAFTQTLQLELRHSPVKVTIVRPTTVAGTDFFRENVPSTRLPRMADFAGYSTPPLVAQAIVGALRDQRSVVNIPGYLPSMYLLFTLAPGLLRRMVSAGGHGRHDYGDVGWRYTPRNSA